MADLTKSADRKLAEARPAWDCFDAVAKIMVPDQSNGETEVVECPLDKTKLRVPGGRKGLLVTCASCNYKFVVTTQSCISANQDKPAHASRLFRKLKVAFGFG